MPVEAFLDTNILIYSFDHSSPRKREMAGRLLQPQNGIGNVGISWQVVQEFVAVAQGRFKKSFTTTDLNDYLEVVLLPICHCWPTGTLFQQAIKIQGRYQYSWYDSLIVTAAISVGAKTLYSEDLQHGQKIGELAVVNPFL